MGCLKRDESYFSKIEAINFKTNFPRAWERMKREHECSGVPNFFARAEFAAKVLQEPIKIFGGIPAEALVNFAKGVAEQRYGGMSRQYWYDAFVCLVSVWKYGEILGNFIKMPENDIAEFIENSKRVEFELQEEFRSAVRQLNNYARGC